MSPEYVIVKIGPFQLDVVILHSVTPDIQDGRRKITQKLDSRHGHQRSLSAKLLNRA